MSLEEKVNLFHCWSSESLIKKGKKKRLRSGFIHQELPSTLMLGLNHIFTCFNSGELCKISSLWLDHLPTRWKTGGGGGLTPIVSHSW